ncbi:hypothetical protein VNO77_44850 [Canavalia gladiata]|uniref:Uncharacterized protein n=1 Tax=Canavalia gladiata TaxID=3824 RepID=A0AAN9PP53_CANGL
MDGCCSNKGSTERAKREVSSNKRIEHPPFPFYSIMETLSAWHVLPFLSDYKKKTYKGYIKHATLLSNKPVWESTKTPVASKPMHVIPIILNNHLTLGQALVNGLGRTWPNTLGQMRMIPKETQEGSWLVNVIGIGYASETILTRVIYTLNQNNGLRCLRFLPRDLSDDHGGFRGSLGQWAGINLLGFLWLIDDPFLLEVSPNVDFKNSTPPSSCQLGVPFLQHIPLAFFCAISVIPPEEAREGLPFSSPSRMTLLSPKGSEAAPRTRSIPSIFSCKLSIAYFSF